MLGPALRPPRPLGNAFHAPRFTHLPGIHAGKLQCFC
jgi:hypothetical protein